MANPFHSFLFSLPSKHAVTPEGLIDLEVSSDNDSKKQNQEAQTSPLLVQRKCACGGACPKCQEDDDLNNEFLIQFKLNRGSGKDAYEKEASEIEQSFGQSSLQKHPRKISKISSKFHREVNSSSYSSLENQMRQKQGKGSPLPNEVRESVESYFGEDFSKVRIHENPTLTKQLHAQAFTSGNDIFFNHGKFNPATITGKKLLAHELTHVVQQKDSKKKPSLISVQRSTEEDQKEAGGLRWYIEVDHPSPIILKGSIVTFRLRNETDRTDSEKQRMSKEAHKGTIRPGVYPDELTIYDYENPEFGVIDGYGGQHSFPEKPGLLGHSYPLEMRYQFTQSGHRTIFFRGKPLGFAGHGGTNHIFVTHEVQIIDPSELGDLSKTQKISKRDEDLLRNSEARYGELSQAFKRLAIRKAFELLAENRQEALEMVDQYPLPSLNTETPRIRAARELFPIYQDLLSRRSGLKSYAPPKRLGGSPGETRMRDPAADRLSDRVRSAEIAKINRRLKEVEKTIRLIKATYPEVAAAHRYQSSYPTMGQHFTQLTALALRQVVRDIDDTRKRLVTGDIPVLSVQSIVNPLLQDLTMSNPDVLTSIKLLQQRESSYNLWTQLGLTGASLALLFVPGIGPFLSAGLGLASGAVQSIKSWEEADDYATAANAGVGSGLFSSDEAEAKRSQAIWDSLFTLIDMIDFGMEATELLQAAKLSRTSRSTDVLDDIASKKISTETEQIVHKVNGVNEETKELLEMSPELRDAVQRFPNAAKAFKLCSSPCLPPIPPASLADYAQFEELLDFMSRFNITFNDMGFDSLHQVKRYLHGRAWRENLTETLLELEDQARQLATQRLPNNFRVWVNTDSNIYHLPDSRHYGTTKGGRYMTLAEAEEAGVRNAVRRSSATPTPSGVYMVERPTKGDPRIVIHSWIGPREARANLERQMMSAGEYASTELQGWQRAHSQGAGLRAESGQAIRLAPEMVNQALQNRGIEAFLRVLRDEAVASGSRIHMTTVTKTTPGTLRLADISYKIDIQEGDRMITLFEANIQVRAKEIQIRDGNQMMTQTRIEVSADARAPGGDTFASTPTFDVATGEIIDNSNRVR
ncbi:MAG: DUF4157 domain-containing protein [Verrucomicrobiota bacterium]